MPTNRTANASNISSWPLVVSDPVDADPSSAALYNTATDKVADAAQALYEKMAIMSVLNWNLRTGANSIQINSVACNSSASSLLFVGVGNNTGSNHPTIVKSSDGVTWTLVTPGTTDTLNLHSVAFNGSKWVAVGGGSSTNDFITFYSSNDGSTWTLNSAVVVGGLPPAGVAWSSALSLWVAACYDSIFTSPDGVTWTNVYSSGVGCSYVAFQNGIFVVLGFGHVYTSTNGTSWTNTAISVPSIAGGLIAANGLFLACDQNHICSSTDGTTWTTRLTLTDNSLRGFAYNGLLWIALRQKSAVVTSLDGINWVARAAAGGSANSGCSDLSSGQFVLSGTNGPGVGNFWQSLVVPS